MTPLDEVGNCGCGSLAYTREGDDQACRKGESTRLHWTHRQELRPRQSYPMSPRTPQRRGPATNQLLAPSSSSASCSTNRPTSVTMPTVWKLPRSANLVTTAGLMSTQTVRTEAGSIRDDGPMPEVITDVMEAQRIMRGYAQQAGACLMLSTMLHSIAVGNMLPASVRTVCVDINPAVVTKLADRGSFQTVGIVTDVGLFVEQLADELEGAGC